MRAAPIDAGQASFNPLGLQKMTAIVVRNTRIAILLSKFISLLPFI
jgi:hypothetical protein